MKCRSVLTSLGGLLVLGAALAVPAATLEWDWTGSPDLTGVVFNIYRDGVLLGYVDDPARSYPYERLGGETLTVEACTPSACSPRSDPLRIPGSPNNLKWRNN